LVFIINTKLALKILALEQRRLWIFLSNFCDCYFKLLSQSTDGTFYFEKWWI